VSNIDIIRKFYSLPRITSADRQALLEMLHPDVRYVGVGKESARGRDAIERLFRKYQNSGHGITSLEFDIRHIAENANAVLVDMVDTFVIDGKQFSAYGLSYSSSKRARSHSGKSTTTSPPSRRCTRVACR
jgi:limonene-1,2-epoxide hydrolase